MHEVRKTVEQMLEAGVPFEHVEAFIENRGLDPMAASALWLLAWAETDKIARRRVVDELLEELLPEAA